ncbi:hypothetical protein B0A54_01308 [Friedmanniomyces endolithicus]|uniref:Cytochrome b5 heme-binding domain-containing protein n=1 Tax=Friedmanniomyces endolithicus TaxID=329885 RepID=A0A4U0VIV4_9PEZI|nr:hypothetical protein B0A54_01308 [Friedmanniomyces endolithicus]
MGRLRVSAFRSCHDGSRGEKPITIFQQTKEGKSQRAQHVENVADIEAVAQHTEIHLEDAGYPILPKRTAVHDLPFIPSIEVAQRDGRGGNRLWIVVDTIILDATEYQEKHPGGRQIISGFAGRDCSWQWWSFHTGSIWHSVAAGLRVGRTEGVSNPFERPPAIVGLRAHGFQDGD